MATVDIVFLGLVIGLVVLLVWSVWPSKRKPQEYPGSDEMDRRNASPERQDLDAGGGSGGGFN